MCNKTINHAAASDAELLALVRRENGRAGGSAAALDVKLALVPPPARLPASVDSLVAINRKVTNDGAGMTWQGTRDKVQNPGYAQERVSYERGGIFGGARIHESRRQSSSISYPCLVPLTIKGDQ